MEQQNHANNAFALIINNFGRKEPRQFFNTGQYFVQDSSKHNYHKSEYKKNFVSSRYSRNNSFNGKSNTVIGNNSKCHEWEKGQNHDEKNFTEDRYKEQSEMRSEYIKKQKRGKSQKVKNGVSKDSIENQFSRSLVNTAINFNTPNNHNKHTYFKSYKDSRKPSNHHQETIHFTNHSPKKLKDSSDILNNEHNIDEIQDSDLFYFDISGNKKESLSNTNTQNQFLKSVFRNNIWNDINGCKSEDFKAFQEDRKESFGNYSKPREIYSDVLHKINKNKLKRDQFVTDVSNTKSDTSKVSNTSFCKKMKNKGCEESINIEKEKLNYLSARKRKRNKNDTIAEFLQDTEKELKSPNKQKNNETVNFLNESVCENIDFNSSFKNIKRKHQKGFIESDTEHASKKTSNNSVGINDDGCNTEIKKKKTKQSKNEYNNSQLKSLEVAKIVENTIDYQFIDENENSKNLLTPNHKMRGKKSTGNVDNSRKSNILEDEPEINFVSKTPKKKRSILELDSPEKNRRSSTPESNIRDELNNSIKVSGRNNVCKRSSKDGLTVKDKSKNVKTENCSLEQKNSSILEGIIDESMKIKYLKKPSSISESESSIIDFDCPSPKKKKKSTIDVNSNINHTITKKRRVKTMQNVLQESVPEDQNRLDSSQKVSKKHDHNESGIINAINEHVLPVEKQEKSETSAIKYTTLDADGQKKCIDHDKNALLKNKNVLENCNHSKRKKKKCNKKVYKPRDSSIYTIFEDDESYDSEIINSNLKSNKKNKKDDQLNIDTTNETNLNGTVSTLGEKLKNSIQNIEQQLENTADNRDIQKYEDDESDTKLPCEMQFYTGPELLNEDIQKLKELTICLPFSVPALHALFTQTTGLTKKQQEEVQRLNLTVKSGPFVKSEDEKIMENWKRLCKEYDLNMNPALFRKFPTKMKMTTKVNILRYIAHGLDNRMLHRVYIRFKNLLQREHLRLGRFTPEEDKIILEFMENTHSRCPFKDLSELLNRSSISIEKRYGILIRGSSKINYTDPDMADRFVKALMDIAKCDKIKKLKHKDFTSKDWRKLSKKLDDIPIKKLERAWKVTIYPRLFCKETSMKEVKEDIIQILIDRKETDWRTVDWKDIAKYFKGFTPEKIYMMFKHLVYFNVPKTKHCDLKECLDFLYNKVVQYNDMSSPHKFKKYVMKNGKLCYESNNKK